MLFSLTKHSVQFSCSVVPYSLRPHEPQHTRSPCPSPTPGVYSNSCPLSWWCYLTISSSLTHFSSYLPSFPASGSFLMSQLFASDGQSIGVSASASVLPVNIQGWFLLGLTGSGFLSSVIHMAVSSFSWLEIEKTAPLAGCFCGIFLQDGSPSPLTIS